jgi:alpha/beta hydrolase family protein
MQTNAWRGAFLAALLLMATAPVAAKVTRLEITSKQPYGTFRAGDYVIWQGRVHGELAPTESIPDIDKPARNARGQVEYSARLILFMPSDPRKGDGTLLVDVPNRGNAYSRALYNSPRDEPYQSGNLEPGNGFLEDHGIASAEVYWELGKGADLPSFTDGEGKKRFVEGVGFAIMRDAADFLAHGSADDAGTPNPLRGAVKRVLGSGKSQTGRYLKTFLLNGFNRVEGRRVFDGMHIFVSSAGLLPILQSGTGPESSANTTPSFAKPDFRGVYEGPFTIGEIVAKVEARGETPPKMILFNTQTDYLSLRASLSRTGADGTTEQAIPAVARVYDIPGGAHATVLARKGCTLPTNRLDWTPVSRAMFLRLESWVARNQEPPASRLMPLEPAGDDPTVLHAPQYLPNAVVQRPQRDAGGNALGGVRLPDLAVPLGTHGMQNAPLDKGCNLIGAYSPFARTKAEREAANDPRPSLEERYRDRADYANRIRLAARELEQAGFLLPEDTSIIIQSAAATRAFK